MKEAEPPEQPAVRGERMEFAEEVVVPIEGELSGRFPARQRPGGDILSAMGKNPLPGVLGSGSQPQSGSQSLPQRRKPRAVYQRHRSLRRPLERPQARHAGLLSPPLSSQVGTDYVRKCAYVVHYRSRSFPSQYEYVFMDGCHFEADGRSAGQSPGSGRRRIATVRRNWTPACCNATSIGTTLTSNRCNWCRSLPKARHSIRIIRKPTFIGKSTS